MRKIVDVIKKPRILKSAFFVVAVVLLSLIGLVTTIKYQNSLIFSKEHFIGGGDYEWDVPDYEETVFTPKMHKYCLIIPILNEGQRFITELTRLQAASISSVIDVVVVDSSSADQAIHPDVFKQYGVKTLLQTPNEYGLGSKQRVGFAWALEQKYEGVVMVDGNNKDSVEDVPLFIDMLEQGYDHVQGSRYLPGGHHENTPLSRFLAMKLIHVPLINLAAKFTYTDTTNGFRAYSGRFLGDSQVGLFRECFSGYELHYYLAICAPRLNFQCAEIPVSRSYPPNKCPSKISAVKGNAKVLYSLFSTVLGKYAPLDSKQLKHKSS